MQFLIDNPVDNLTDEVIVSARLAKFPFKIKGMTAQNFRIPKAPFRLERKGNLIVKSLMNCCLNSYLVQ